MIHAVLIVSAASQAKAEALGQAMGWGFDNYTVKLSNRVDGVVTHYGLATPVSDGFVALYEAAKAGVAPPGIDPIMISVVSLLTVSFDHEGAYTSPLDHFNTFIAENNLRIV